MSNAPRRKIPTLKPRLRELGTPLDEWKKARAKASGRDADPRRALPLNSAAWQRLRASVLADEPLCRECAERGLTVEATDVDHHDGDPGNNEPDNLVPLCHADHSRKTARDHSKRVSGGCDANGMPLDPDHPWNK